MKLGRWISLMALLVALYLLWRLQQVVLLIFTAVILTIPLNRLVRRWQRTGMQRSVAVALSMVTLLTLLLLFVGLIVPPFLAQLQQLFALVLQALQQLHIQIIQSQSRLLELLQLSTLDLIRQTQPLITWLFDHALILFSDVVAILLRLLLILVLTLMLLINPLAYRQSLIRLCPSFYRPRIDAILSQCEDKLVNWMQSTVWQMLFVGVTSAIGLWILQVPLALTNATLAGLLEIIPYLGVVLSLVPPVAAGGLDAPWKAAAVILLYLLIQYLKHNSLKRLGQPKTKVLLPALMLLFQLSFAFFGGIWGLLLAVPIVIISQVCTREIVIKDLLHSRS